MKRISWRFIQTRLILIGIAGAFLITVPIDTPAGNTLDTRVLGRARNDLFNFVDWEANALTEKFDQQQTGLAPFLTEAQGSRYVHDYLDLVKQIQDLNGKIDQIYSDPAVENADSASADLRAKRDALRSQVDHMLPLAESIIEGQVAAVLRDEGFSTYGQILPPVSSHITQLPMLLVVSQRNKISFETGISLNSIPVDEQEKLERSIDQDLNVSSLVVPLGGLSLYPSMVDQTSDPEFAFEVVAHEWTHHYLYFFPLGLGYTESDDTRAINETTAVMNGKEIARKVILRYYRDFPDIKLPEPPASASANSNSDIPLSPFIAPPFDFNATMNETRVHVDKLLADGKIKEAEDYMEQQRQVFLGHGYQIRKLNQAYFAFYGGYQSPTDTGASGADPIGPAIVDIRAHSPSEKAWLETMRSITTRDELMAVYGRVAGKSSGR